ncbi:1-(5-phosphoribosyl)-5-[(5-phosphoribosylamino)methylideneamino] imidazole-4-carboxamide isomerase [Geodia barretti]|uniref:1-(5-phosphoribosyl)-5-[(5-phosphoribosylamino)me thylideneamino] imidazole-4-carboxamide isomerase n=1 Tax=Geodia barretti TaxID=519541 RepID=A0AA35W962_GEOBA|nr:1-(5-phosphoribosyl)-5-[(5-phosphoribosylamino)methylideneamino] imidazole-4-carboxamide isomerase [Geodia barretti]
MDAARGSGANREAIDRIRRAVDVRIQVGGGVRTAEDAEALLDLGVDAVVVGTTLATRTAEVLSWAERWPGRMVGGIDARMGQVQLAGLVYTAVDRDGMLGGPDLAGGSAAAGSSGLPVLFSGGVGSQADLAAIAATDVAAGAIVGTAIYERRVDLRSAIEVLQHPSDTARWAA